jgi:hypothetical protein
MEVNGQRHSLAPLTAGREPQVLTEYEAGWVPEQFGHFEEEKNLLPVLGIKHWSIRTIA